MADWDYRLNPPRDGVSPVRAASGPGANTRSQLRGSGWRRTSHGLYLRHNTPLTPTQRIVDAAARLPSYGALGGWAAAYWMGVRYLDGFRGGQPQPVLLNIGDGTGHIRPFPGVQPARTRLLADDVIQVRGIAVTTPVRTAYDGCRLAPTLTEAVIFLDMMLASGLLGREEMAAYLPEHRAAWKGVAQVREAFGLARSGSRSPQETRLRLLWVSAAGLPAPLLNTAVFSDDGLLLGLPDLLDPDAAVAGEYDGGQHREARHHSADNVREEQMEAHGLVVTRVSNVDLTQQAATIRRLRTAWERGMTRDRSRDRWTLDPPSWYLDRQAG